MKLFNIFFTFVFCLVVISRVGYCFVDDIKVDDLRIGYRYSFFDIRDADYQSNTTFYSFNLTKDISKHVDVELEGGYIRLDSKAGTIVRSYPLLINFYLHPSFKRIDPYVGFGIGAMRFDHSSLGPGDRKDNEYGHSWKLVYGIEHSLNKDFSLNFSSAYLHANTGGKATLDIYGWLYSAGIKISF